MKRMLTILMLLAAAVAAMAQSQIRMPMCPAALPDSADVAYYGRKHPLRAAATVACLNTGVWAWDRFGANADYARISIHSIAENFKHGFVWDNDQLGTNMFLHPYHGNLYFNAGRANGLNFWQSGLCAVGGSLSWELFFENEYPSTNDVIATPIGGVAIGEVLFRASDLIVKDNSSGWERAGREAAVFLVSPMRGVTRIINGDAWRHRATTGRVFGQPEIEVELSAGARLIGYEGQPFDRGVGGCLELDIAYGDRFELTSTTPYDYFKFRINLNAQASQPVLSELHILGRLLSREVVDTRSHQLSAGLYQLFDFYDSDTISSKSGAAPYKLGIPASAGPALMYRWQCQGCSVDAFAGAGGILLGGVLTDHYHVDNRDYNLGSGFSLKTGVNAVWGGDLASLSLQYSYYRMFTWGYPRGTDIAHADERTLNAEGDASVAYFGVANIRADVRICPKLYVTADFTHYARSSRYRDFPSVRSNSLTARLMLTYKF